MLLPLYVTPLSISSFNYYTLLPFFISLISLIELLLQVFRKKQYVVKAELTSAHMTAKRNNYFLA